MHTVLGLLSLLLVVCGSSVALRLLPPPLLWSERRLIQLSVLLMPLAFLGLDIGGSVHHFLSRLCPVGPPWDMWLGIAFPLLLGLLSVTTLGLGIVRLLLMKQVMKQRAKAADGNLQLLVDALTRKLGIRRVRLALCEREHPVALTYGIFHPKVLVSTWMIEHLDGRELEAVLAHELAHVARKDYLVIWVATILRDAFFYLPTSRAAYQLLHYEKELACDDRVVQTTRRPLALASALTKVWLHMAEGAEIRKYKVVQPFAQGEKALHERVQRLLGKSAVTPPPRQPHRVLSLNRSTFMLMSGILGAYLVMTLALLLCNPLAVLVVHL